MKKNWANIGCMLLIIGLSACSISGSAPYATMRSGTQAVTASADAVQATPADRHETPTPLQPPAEAQVAPLVLDASMAKQSMEYSGLAWFQDWLVLLPQYPEKNLIQGQASLFAIPKQSITDALNHPSGEALPWQAIAFEDDGLSESIRGFEGFESIAFNGDEVFMTIESRSGSPMLGYLVRGTVSGAIEQITLDADTLVRLDPQTSFSNASDEAITLFNGMVYTFFEDNGFEQNPQPIAHQFSIEDPLQAATIPFPNINYRITDATSTDSEGYLWVMNYFYPGDTHLQASSDALAEAYGQGATHQDSDVVERIIKLQIDNAALRLVDEPPVQLQLFPENEARNWEGLVVLDDLGFLVVTDSFPESILAFVPADL
jgi:hypothetical protein